MRLLRGDAPPARLLAMFVLLTGLPLAALAWLGARVLDQDRALASQRRLERLQNAANELADALTTATRGPATELARGVGLPTGRERITLLRFDGRRLVERRGVPLLYYPDGVTPPDAPAHVFARIEDAELANPVWATEQYTRLTASIDAAVRAGAYVRLARVQLRNNRTQEALGTYEALLALGATPVAGAPAELVARRQRAALFQRAGDLDAAAAERTALAAALSEGRFVLDRTTFDFYAEGLPAVTDRHHALTNAVAEWWPRWHAEPSGRMARTTADGAFAAAWRSTADGTIVAVGYDTTAGVATTEETARRHLLLAGFALVAVILLGAGYMVFRALQRELNVARLQSEFVAQVSHEFRTPLTAMRHLTELLEDGAAPPARLEEFHRALGKETRRLHTMVESLLDFKRIESGRQVYDMEDASLAEVAERVVSAFDSPRLQLIVGETSPRSRIDRDAVALAVQNLVDNAMKYSPSSAPVRISVDAAGDKARISVEDQGAGLSPEEQRAVRRKFVRGSAARALNVKGTGIGLAIVDQVARAHGGRLDVDSEPGRGSRFTLSVPLAGQPS